MAICVVLDAQLIAKKLVQIPVVLQHVLHSVHLHALVHAHEIVKLTVRMVAMAVSQRVLKRVA